MFTFLLNRIVFSVLFVIPLLSVANPKDSLQKLLLNKTIPDTMRVKVLDELCYTLTLQQQDSAIYYGNEAIALARKINYQKGLGLALSDLGVAYFYKADLPMAITLWEEAQNVRASIRDLAGVASLNIKLGAAYFKQGNYSKSFESQTKALQAFEKLNHIQGQANALNNMAAVLEHQQEYQQALVYHKKSLHLALKNNISESYGISLINIGNIFQKTNQYDSAIWYWQKSLSVLNEKQSPQYCAVAYHNLGEVFTIQNHVQKGIENNKKALLLRQQLNDKQGYISSLINLGSAYTKQKNYKLGEQYLTIALDSLKRNPLKVEEQKVWQNLAQLYEETGRPLQALESYKKFVQVKDTLLNLNTKETVNKLLIQFEAEKKDAQLAKQEIDLLTHQNKLNKSYAFLFGVLLLLVLITGFYVLARSRFKRKTILLEKEKQVAIREAYIDATLQSQEDERKRVSRDLHDGIGQLITELRFLLGNLEQTKPTDERIIIVEQSEKVLNDMHKEVRSVAFNLMPQTLIQNGIVPALKEMALRIENAHTIRVQVVSFDLDIRLSELIEISVYRIVQEWTNNIIKYAQASSVVVNLVRSETEIILTIEDNGKGFDAVKLQRSNGLGWKNISSRAHLIKATLDIDTKPEANGTTLVLQIPNKQPKPEPIENTH
ncbi:MAG: tetratricopeptide repeat protein [Cyclobacteriaceae bacterium]|jgi:two-component system NarL family sensor kinase|nr:tetratricopeptide repeat protein [Cytophagales bacterium]MCZ8328704.1 tetratricopeptide repeat protein [Cyclobacteriaceae bacterium]